MRSEGITAESSEIAGRPFTVHTLHQGHTVKSDV